MARRRLGICGGPYSNPYALQAFVDDARARGCDDLICLGDLGGFGADVDGLWPIIDGNAITCVAGNYDVAIARGDPDCGCGYRDPTDNTFAQLIYDHTREHTDPAFAAWMGTLPVERRLDVEGCDVHLVHGSTIALNDFWWDSLPDEEHRARVAASGADVICCTHSGLPWTRRVDGTLVVNVGVLGKPANDGTTDVWYAIVEVGDGEPDATLVRLPYDWRAQAASMRAAGLPEAFVETIETGWWTTCIEVLPPAERAAGRYQLYRSTLPTAFATAGASWGDAPTADAHPTRPVVELFGTAYFPPRLWVYTNFHCNLACDYCAVGSSPRARRRAIPADTFTALVDEAVAEGFTEIYVTGGEPFLHPGIVDLLAYAADRLPTVVLSNGMLLGGRRAEGLRRLAATESLVLQTSLDGSGPATHDPHRGEGSWERAMAGIRTALDAGIDVRVALTETPENSDDIPALAKVLADIGIAGDSFMVRPLLRRGLSTEGLDIDGGTTVPELTYTTDGWHWHPAGADLDTSPDMLLVAGDVPLRRAKQLVTERFFAARLADGSLPRPYRCAV
ncbi:MAG TPA: radical SAM protein [Acidimicrobiales bacterium]|nr:radical SAM protein [Acidimicrobiales bacterium]